MLGSKVTVAKCARYPIDKDTDSSSSLTNLLNGVTWEWSWTEEGERGYPGRGKRVEGPRGGLVGVKVRGLEGVDGARRHWFYGGSLEQTQKRTGLAKKYYTVYPKIPRALRMLLGHSRLN